MWRRAATFEVINFLSKKLRRFSFTKDFWPRVLLQLNTYEEQRKPTQIFTKSFKEKNVTVLKLILKKLIKILRYINKNIFIFNESSILHGGGITAIWFVAASGVFWRYLTTGHRIIYMYIYIYILLTC